MMLIWIKVNWIILNCEISLFKKNKFNIIYWNTDFYGCQDELTQQVVTCKKSMVETLFLSLESPQIPVSGGSTPFMILFLPNVK